MATRRPAFRIAAILAALAIAAGACGTADDSASDDTVAVVTTTTMLGDVARHVVGDAGTVEVLLPIGTDPHEYQASSRQVALIQDADLVMVNGLGLEDGLADVLSAAARDGATILEIAPLLDPLPFGEGDLDPHVWFDPIRMAAAARLIANELDAVAPGMGWASRAETYAAALGDADAEISDILARVPAQRRRLVTNHDALGYFAARYSFDLVGVVIPGGSTLSNPSSSALSELVRVTESEGVPAIFAETTDTSALADAVASEVDGGIEVIDLYTGSLGEPGSGAETLIDMLLTNARRIAGALA